MIRFKKLIIPYCSDEDSQLNNKVKLCKAADAQGTFVSVHLIMVSTKYRFVLLKIWEEPFETYWAIYPHNSEGSLLNMGFA